MVDAHNLSLVEKDVLDTNITSVVAKIKDNKINMSKLKCNETKIECLFENIEIDDKTRSKSAITNINKSISNQELYNANKSQVRKDMAEFESEVYKVEDSINADLLSRKAGK